jgi:class 3 adenylate cyclase
LVTLRFAIETKGGVLEGLALTFSSPNAEATRGVLKSPGGFHMIERPTGTITFLITDIEQSTRRWEEAPGEMREALAKHDGTLRQAIESAGGWPFKHTGDGVVAAFATPRSAAEAAIMAQRLLELPVRMAICTGEA